MIQSLHTHKNIAKKESCCRCLVAFYEGRAAATAKRLWRPFLLTILCAAEVGLTCCHDKHKQKRIILLHSSRGQIMSPWGVAKSQCSMPPSSPAVWSQKPTGLDIKAQWRRQWHCHLCWHHSPQPRMTIPWSPMNGRSENLHSLVPVIAVNWLCWAACSLDFSGR